MYIIKVPDNLLTVRYDDEDGEGKTKTTVKKENYFWYCLKAAVRQQLAKMSGVEILQFEDLHKEILAQDGKSTLKITRESEYEKLKGWVENLTGWPGKVEDVVRDAGAVVRAFREAEKVKESPNAKAK